MLVKQAQTWTSGRILGVCRSQKYFGLEDPSRACQVPCHGYEGWRAPFSLMALPNAAAPGSDMELIITGTCYR
jgi:hypothetical protein